MQPEPLDRGDVENIARDLIESAQDYCEASVREHAAKAIKYMNGEVDLSSEPGKSRLVATKVRDVVQAAKPAILRTLLQSGFPCEFVPGGEQEAPVAALRTEKVRQTFEKAGGFMAVHDALDDALVHKIGVVKVYWDETEETEIDEYTGLNPLAAQFIVAEAGVEVLEAEEATDDAGQPVVNMKIAKVMRGGKICYDVIRPEDFFVNAEARGIHDFTVCGHSTEMTVSDLVALGVDYDVAVGLDDDDEGEEEQYERTGWTEEQENKDPTLKKVTVTEAYMRLDVEGVGIAQMYKLLMGGSNHQLLDMELCDEVPFAIFEVDPEPHTFHGRSMAEKLFADQDVATVLMRGLADGVISATAPKWVYNRTQVNRDDLAVAHRHGALIGVDDVNNSIREVNLGTASASVALPAIQQHDASIAAKTGVGGPGLGLDADALSGQSATAANIAERAATAQMELMARVVAEGGMRRLCLLTDMLIRQHPDDYRAVQVDGEWQMLDPRSWGRANISVNVGLGSNRGEERKAALVGMTQLQLNIYQTLGPGNPIVGLAEIRAGIAATLKAQGIYNAGEFFKPFAREQEMAMLQQQAMAAGQNPQQGDPQVAAFMQTEQMKAMTRAQTDREKLALDAMKARMEDDRKRDEMAQKRALDAAKLEAETGLKVNEQLIKAEQAAPRF